MYDVSLWEFLKYASTQKQGELNEEFFPFTERLEMTKRICDGLLHMNREKSVAHRDIKPRPGSQKNYDESRYDYLNVEVMLHTVCNILYLAITNNLFYKKPF